MSDNKNQKKEKRKLLYESFKIWCGLILILTLFYILYNYLRDDYIMEILRDHKVKCLKTITPKYPPPLLNFVDPSDYVSVKSIV